MFKVKFWRSRLNDLHPDFEISTPSNFEIAVYNWLAMHPNGRVEIEVTDREKRVHRPGWKPTLASFWNERIC